MRVCVVGAGIAGLSVAYALCEAGHEVTVIDRAGVSAGASAANGAQLSYSYVQPLADPAIWAQLPRLLWSRSPLRLKPALDTAQWQWAVRFLLACNTARFATTQRLLVLAAASRTCFDAIRERESLDCDFSATGKLVLYRTRAGFDAAARQLHKQALLGGREQRAVGPEEALAIEPALAAQEEPLAGAIHTPSECAADCEKVCAQLATILRRRGARFLLGHHVLGFEERGGLLCAARTVAGEVEGDAFVLAAGVASATLARPFGLRLPLYPLKGYSITLDVEEGAGAPRVNVTDSDRKLVFARIGQRLRVAGMAELVGDDVSIPAARVRTLLEGLRALFPDCRPSAELRPWTGMRPATPTGEPIVGRLAGAPANLLFNTGHGALGFTLAFATAQQVAASLAPR